MAALDWSQMPWRREHPWQGQRCVGFSRRPCPGVGDLENLQTSPSEEVLENFHVTREQVQAVLDFTARSAAPRETLRVDENSSDENVPQKIAAAH